MAVKSIMIVGVGGQGTLLASRLLGSALIDSGYEVKVSEIHGMSQRGGSVVTYVKYGDEVFSPTIEQGEADIILAFEKLEAARWLSFLKPDGKLVVNDQCIDPMPVITGAAEYPQNISEAIKAAGASMIELDALSLAVKAGSAKAVKGSQCCSHRRHGKPYAIKLRDLDKRHKEHSARKVPRYEP